MKKAVLKLEVHGDNEKKKAMKIVSGLPGVDSLSVDTKDKKLTVIGDIDPVTIAIKLRKLCHTEVVSVGPAKEPEKKKEEPKKEEPKKDDRKKDETKRIKPEKKEEEPKKEEPKKDDKKKDETKRIKPEKKKEDSLSVDMKDKKLTVIGDIDPVTIVIKLRKLCLTGVVSVGPAKEPEKKEEPKKEEPKKDDKKKDETKRIKPEKKKEEPKKDDKKKDETKRIKR